MRFEHSCFISYRLGKGKLGKRIIEDLHSALSDELELSLDESVYLSEKRLQGGDFLDPALESALCASVCMIAVFTAKYFSTQHVYCTREYLGMEILEKARLDALGVEVNKKHGLIIPIVLRDRDYLPDEIDEKRVWHDFQEFMPDEDQENRIRRPHRYFVRIREIASYILDRRWELGKLDVDPCDCAKFQLPTKKESREFLAKLLA